MIPLLYHTLASDIASMRCLDDDSLPTQTRMETVVENIPDNDCPQMNYFPFHDEMGDFIDYTEWKGVECTEKGAVKVIEWGTSTAERRFFRHGGTMKVHWLPSTVERVNVEANGLQGEVDCTRLPADLREIFLKNNQFSGSVDLRQLPHSLKTLAFNYNSFSGSVDLTKLPWTLRSLHLESNQFSGYLDLTLLPEGINRIYLQKNAFSGGIDLRYIPGWLRELDLSDNGLYGLVVMREWLMPLQKLDLSGNDIRGVDDVNGNIVADYRLKY